MHSRYSTFFLLRSVFCYVVYVYVLVVLTRSIIRFPITEYGSKRREKKRQGRCIFFSPLLHRSFASIIKYTMMTYYDDRQLTYDACEFISFSNRKYALEDLARIESEELIIS